MRRALALLLAGASTLLADDIVNPGFEDGLTDWMARTDRGMSAVLPEAAHTGKGGLRVSVFPRCQETACF